MRSAGGARPDGIALRVLRSVFAAHQRLLGWAAPGPAIWDPKDFAGLPALTGGWATVRDEYDALDSLRVRHEFEEVAGMPLGVEGDWHAHFLFDEGRALPPASDLCPATMALLDPIDGLRSAYFSVMGPGTRLLPHAGPNRSILRAHLTLRAPDAPGAAGIEIGGVRIDYQPGEAFVFDDTVEHEVWNAGDVDRVTLMLDVRRPLPAWLRPVDALVQLLWRLHPVRRSAGRRLAELDAARNR
jgi:beta-hydroxylase